MNTSFLIAAAAVVGLLGLPAAAQPVAQPKAQPPAFKSALESYRPYTDEKLVDWKTANDTTARVGGWRAYAKEAGMPAMDSMASKPDTLAPRPAAKP